MCGHVVSPDREVWVFTDAIPDATSVRFEGFQLIAQQGCSLDAVVCFSTSVGLGLTITYTLCGDLA